MRESYKLALIDFRVDERFSNENNPIMKLVPEILFMETLVVHLPCHEMNVDIGRNYFSYFAETREIRIHHGGKIELNASGQRRGSHLVLGQNLF